MIFCHPTTSTTISSTFKFEYVDSFFVFSLDNLSTEYAQKGLQVILFPQAQENSWELNRRSFTGNIKNELGLGWPQFSLARSKSVFMKEFQEATNGRQFLGARKRKKTHKF